MEGLQRVCASGYWDAVGLTICPRDQCCSGHRSCPLESPHSSGSGPPLVGVCDRVDYRRHHGGNRDATSNKSSPSPSSFPFPCPHLLARARRAAVQVPLCESSHDQATESTRSTPTCSARPRTLRSAHVNKHVRVPLRGPA